jgi:hypothetical protein
VVEQIHDITQWVTGGSRGGDEDKLRTGTDCRPRYEKWVWAGGTGQEFGVYEAIDQAGGALSGLLMVPCV